MDKPSRPITVLCAEDDADDRMLLQEAWNEGRVANPLAFVEDGEELMDYLSRRNKYANLTGTPLPGLILLDLNMPKMDGREALRKIKSDPHLRRIPVVALTTSNEEAEIVRAYDLGVNSFVVKPVTFQSLVDFVSAFGRYWFEVVELSCGRAAA